MEKEMGSLLELEGCEAFNEAHRLCVSLNSRLESNQEEKKVTWGWRRRWREGYEAFRRRCKLCGSKAMRLSMNLKVMRIQRTRRLITSTQL